jgi:hypothetical protein
VPPSLDYAALARQRHAAAVEGGHLNRLAARLGVRADALTVLGVGWARDRVIFREVFLGDGTIDHERVTIIKEFWSFPERDAGGTVLGNKLRFPKLGGQKDDQQHEGGGHAGLSFPDDWVSRPGPVLLVEGGSDTAAGLTMGLCAIGRPSNTGGIDHLAQLLAAIPADHLIVVVGENDERVNEHGVQIFPGRDGAISTAQTLAERLGRPVLCALAPAGAKDARAWLNAQDPDLSDERALAGLGEQFLGALLACAQTVEPPQPVSRELLPEPTLEQSPELAPPVASSAPWSSALGHQKESPAPAVPDDQQTAEIIAEVDQAERTAIPQANAWAQAHSCRPAIYLDRNPPADPAVTVQQTILQSRAPLSLTVLRSRARCADAARRMGCGTQGLAAGAYPSRCAENCQNMEEVRQAEEVGLNPTVAVCPGCTHNPNAWLRLGLTQEELQALPRDVELTLTNEFGREEVYRIV